MNSSKCIPRQGFSAPRFIASACRRCALARRGQTSIGLIKYGVPLSCLLSCLGDEPIAETYIYPRIGPLTRDKVLQTVMAILKRSGRAQPLTFTFAAGTARRAIPTGIQLQSGRGLPIVLLDPGSGQSQAVAADDVINIQ